MRVGVNAWSGRFAARLLLAFASCLLIWRPVNAADAALLVGVSEYPLIDRRLAGPANDLRLMRHAMRRMAFAPPLLIELSDRPEAAAKPTRAQILASLARLADQARPGDWLLVYFSGHGAQAPQTDATLAAYREPDGFDELFLTSDTARWDRRQRRVEGAIRDDEIGAALRTMASRGARVWAVFDTCHASDMTRAATPRDPDPVQRFVGLDVLGVPTPEWLRAGAPTVDRQGKAPRRSAPSATTGSIIVFAAAAKDESTSEEWFVDPLTDDGRRSRFGLFTYKLHGVLEARPQTFAQAAKALERAYADRPFPSPRFEGPLAQPLPSPPSSRGLADAAAR